MLRAAVLLLTVFTGFSGLVYEVAWQRYLASLLGSHSEATAAVLGIFLAGLSLGYSLFGVVTQRVVSRAEAQNRAPRLLLLYGTIEAGIGVYALLFPTLFGLIQALSIRIPHGAGGAGFLLDVTLAALLVLPPTILMGGTIPILTQALARSLADATRFHAFVYAFNTAGAFVGALAAGFFLIPKLGLVNVMITVSVINLSAGALFVVLGWRGRAVISLEDEGETDTADPGPGTGGLPLYVAVALLSGFAMMSVQTVLIRLGGLSFGSSEFTFSMVVAVFVLCIALGSFAVSVLPRIPAALLIVNQWALFLALYFLYEPLEQAPYWAHVLRTLFRDEAAAFYPYYFASFLGVLVVIGPAVVLSGATLPLLFHHLRRRAGHLGSLAGTLYSWNTVGSLLGAMLGGYALLFWLDLDHVYRIAVAAVAVSAVMLTVRVYAFSPLGATALLLAPVLGAVTLLGSWEPKYLSAGLFRSRQAGPATYLGAKAAIEQHTRSFSLPFYDDDPTASVAVSEHQLRGGIKMRSIINNGKGDGSTHLDYPTMGLAATIPALLAEKMEQGFVIGLGTGITAGELGTFRSTRKVVVAEISKAVIDAAPLFDFANQNVTGNPKIELLRSDAYRALVRSQESFDVIVSEPSNPWVTGVEMLYSREFLEVARARLSPGGVYAQWYHQYETDPASVALVLRTYGAVFDHVAIWYGLGADLLLLGFKDDQHALDLRRLERRAARPDFAAALARSGVDSFPELLAHELLPLGVLHAARLEGPIHTLYHPRLSHRAGSAFFRGARGTLPFTGFGEPARVGARNSLLRRYAERFGGRLPEPVETSVTREVCTHRAPQCAVLLASWMRRDPGSPVLAQLMAESAQATVRFGGPVAPETVRGLAGLFAEPAAGAAAVPQAAAQLATTRFRAYYHHASPFAAETLMDLWNRCRPEPATPNACRQGLSRARALLSGRSLAAAGSF